MDTVLNGQGASLNGDSNLTENGLPDDEPLMNLKREPPATPVKSPPPPPAAARTEQNNNETSSPTQPKPHVSSPSFSSGHTKSPKKEQPASDSEDDVPLSERFNKSKEQHRTPTSVKKEKIEPKRPIIESDDEDDVPLSVRAKKNKKAESSEKKTKRKVEGSDDDDDYQPQPKKEKKEKHHHRPHHHEIKTKMTDAHLPKKKHKHKVKHEPGTSPKKKGAKEEPVVWKWWEEERRDDGKKWHTLEHNGPLFAPPYERLPKSVHFRYKGEKMRLSEAAEEVATFYGRMIDHEYVTKPEFNHNFMHDWRKVMTSEERQTITDLSKCDFREIDAYFKQKSEERKNMSKEEKEKNKKQREAEQEQYGTAIVDGYEQKIGNFRIEPPGLFRGRGGHPKMGKLKRRVRPEDVTINCSKGSTVTPPEGHRWKEVRHDNTVTWLASWTENVLGQNKYVMLNPSSRLKGEKDWQKFETARKLHRCVDEIRERYKSDFKSKEMRVRQRAVALYFIDKLALRAGNEKETDEAADTVGCCSLRVEHIKLYDELDGKEYVCEFDFLGKDSIRYFNQVPVEKRVYKNLKLFMQNKKGGDDLFDRLNTSVLNKHLQDLMEGLTAKVFRTYNASITLQEQLKKLTEQLQANGGTAHIFSAKANPANKILSYNRANRAVAVLCNHQRAVPKSHEKSMENLSNKIKDKKKEVKELKKELETCRSKVEKDKVTKRLATKRDQLKKLKVQATDKDENKTIALGTSKLNYLDPRISVAWCKKHDIDLSKVYNRTQREKFQWAIDMIMNSEEEFVF